MTSIAELLDRVRAATGPDRELGRDLLRLAGYRETTYGHFHGPLIQWSSPDAKVSFKDDDFRRYDPTASVDAALALVERKLPGWAVEMERWTGQASATLLECGADGWRKSGMRRSEGKAPTLPLAIILAMLSALSNEVKHDDR